MCGMPCQNEKFQVFQYNSHLGSWKEAEALLFPRLAYVAGVQVWKILFRFLQMVMAYTSWSGITLHQNLNLRCDVKGVFDTHSQSNFFPFSIRSQSILYPISIQGASLGLWLTDWTATERDTRGWRGSSFKFFSLLFSFLSFFLFSFSLIFDFSLF